MEQQNEGDAEKGMPPKMKEKMDGESVKNKKIGAKSAIPRRTMPAELLNEMFAELPLENAFELLAKMPNGLLARNVRRMLKHLNAMKNNKWNAAECGPNLAISEDGLVLTHSGPNRINYPCCIADPTIHFCCKKTAYCILFGSENSQS